ncbi:MAG: glycosyltransferase [Candidatus Rokubacteria bacterium]|nr:glycosyltransferase [Candidatus Rokubacteria bacterium]
MRVLHLHRGDDVRWGGGVIAMTRLHQGLRRHGIDSRILCAVKSVPTPDTVAIPRWRIERGLRPIGRRLGLNDLHGLSALAIPRLPAFRQADVVHIHSLHGGYFTYFALPAITRAKPTVYTLHDMWPYTGHSASSYECGRWKTGCGHCPHLDAPPAVRRDATRTEWRIKDAMYRRSRLWIVTLSESSTAQVRESMLGRFPVRRIPSGVDTAVYRPLDPAFCRRVFGIAPDRRVALAIATRLDPTHPEGWRKGADLLIGALAALPAAGRHRTTLLLVGGHGQGLRDRLDLEVVETGFLASDRLKAIAYSAADVFLHPTRADILPLVVQESLACGTPVVSFGVGGVPDMVHPGLTGFLAEPGDVAAFREHAARLLEDGDLARALRPECRRLAEQEYALDLEVRRHVELYHEILGKEQLRAAA